MNQVNSTTALSLLRIKTLPVLRTGFGYFLGIGLVAALAATTGQPWLLSSFGASCVLLFGFPDVPFSRARNVIGGHLLTSATALVMLSLFGPHWVVMALAAAIACMLMVATSTVHPPAGGNPIVVFMSQPGWEFLLLPAAAGAVGLYALSRLYHRVFGQLMGGMLRIQQRIRPRLHVKRLHVAQYCVQYFAVRLLAAHHQPDTAPE